MVETGDLQQIQDGAGAARFRVHGPDYHAGNPGLNNGPRAPGSILNLLQIPRFNHQAEITSGVCGEECSALLSDFFRRMRETANKSR